MDPPWFPRTVSCDSSQDHDCTHIDGLLCEATVPPGLDGCRALPPQQFDDLCGSLLEPGSGRAGRTCLAITTLLPTQSSGGSQALRCLSLAPGPLVPLTLRSRAITIPLRS